MIALCHKCGSTKPAPFQTCRSCGVAPANEDELALAFMLTDQFLPEEQMVETSRLIKSGQRIELPPHVRTKVIEAIRSVRSKHDTSSKQGLSLRGWGILGGIVILLFVFFHPWPHFQWAAIQDDVSTYESFVNRFPTSDYSATARERIRVLREPTVWAKAQAADQIDAFRGYAREYPVGKHANEAISRMTELADAEWNSISDSRSEAEIRKFLVDYPETSMAASAEARIQQLYNDWDWVREQDSIEDYQRFAARFPEHPQRSWIEKRIIDLEVKEIAAGDYGEMPRAQALSFGGSTAQVTVENQTGYVLTVRYSGIDSKKLVIPKGATQLVTLRPGNYQVAASVTALHVRNYYGTDSMRGGHYSSSFYIETSFGSFSPRRPRRQ